MSNKIKVSELLKITEKQEKILNTEFFQFVPVMSFNKSGNDICVTVVSPENWNWVIWSENKFLVFRHRKPEFYEKDQLTWEEIEKFLEIDISCFVYKCNDESSDFSYVLKKISELAKYLKNNELK